MSQQTVWVVMRSYDDNSGAYPELVVVCASLKIARRLSREMIQRNHEMPKQVEVVANKEYVDLHDGYGRLIIYPVYLIGE